MNKHIILIMGLLSLVFVSCGKQQEQSDKSVPVVRVDSVKSLRTGTVLQFPGRVVSAADANLAFKVAGTLRHVYVEEGSHVRAGQLVAELDDTDYKVQLNATKAEYAQIKADAERVIALYKEGGTTASNYDKARFGLEQIEAKLQHHTNQLKYTRIYAPYAGQVQQVLFKGNETVAAGMPVISLVGSQTPEVEVNLPASSYVNRDNFAGYECSLDVLPEKQIPLSLISILPQANANQLYTMRLRMKENNRQIAPGMSAWVSIYVHEGANSEVSIPVTALVEKDGKADVFVYNSTSETVKRVPVDIVRLHTDGSVEVTGNVTVGSQVVSAGAHHIKDGQKVSLVPPMSETNVGGLL